MSLLFKPLLLYFSKKTIDFVANVVQRTAASKQKIGSSMPA